LIFSNELGDTSTARVLIELDEYVRRNPALSWSTAREDDEPTDLLETTLVECARVLRVPVIDKLDGLRREGVVGRTGVFGAESLGTAGGVGVAEISIAGASLMDDEPEALVGTGGASGALWKRPPWKSAFVLGAETTRRINLAAADPLGALSSAVPARQALCLPDRRGDRGDWPGD
jgi:hypothetical protein